MPEICVPPNHCGVSAPGWLDGNHPLVADGVVNRQVCFTWESDCCFFSNNIAVRNCTGFYVYRLQPPLLGCLSRYCGNGVPGVSRSLPNFHWQIKFIFYMYRGKQNTVMHEYCNELKGPRYLFKPFILIYAHIVLFLICMLFN